MRTFTFPMICCQVPHQFPPVAMILESEADLFALADKEGGDNWEWPGHWDGDTWVDERTVDDAVNAIRHDQHITYFIERDDIETWTPSPHQGIAARHAVEAAATQLGWKEEAPCNE